MAVYERGYRAYEGGFESHRPATAIFRRSFGITFRTRSFKILGIITLLAYAICMLQLFVMLNVQEVVERQFRRGKSIDFAMHTIRFLNPIMLGFYWTTTFAGAIVAMLGGAGLIADDIRTKSLALHLVRPIRPISYVLGKALVLPALLTIILLLPGISMWLFAGLWQPEGTVGTFLSDNLSVLGRVVHQYVVAALGFTGLMLFLSSRTGRRGWVIGVAAGVIFGGVMLALMGRELQGTTQAVLKHASLALNALAPMQVVVEANGAESGWRFDEAQRSWPEADAAIAVAVLVFLIGCFAVWRRARSAEISE